MRIFDSFIVFGEFRRFRLIFLLFDVTCVSFASNHLLPHMKQFTSSS